MPACSALGCHKGGHAVLKLFPRKDLRRRQIWIDRVNRPGWTPTNNSTLCEHHFDRDQWELPREDGKRKLKGSAVPTIFVVPYSRYGEVEQEHPYCLPFYRQIYENIDQKEGNTKPIEHIQVVKSENFLPEFVEEDEEVSWNMEVIEDVQCTPDISVFPEKGEPFPIEAVDCDDDDNNALLLEPNDDPLAISAEDQVHAATEKPYFGRSQRLLFVPKETKMPVNILSKAKGEPQVLSVPKEPVDTLSKSEAEPEVLLVPKEIKATVAKEGPKSCSVPIKRKVPVFILPKAKGESEVSSVPKETKVTVDIPSNAKGGPKFFSIPPKTKVPVFILPKAKREPEVLPIPKETEVPMFILPMEKGEPEVLPIPKETEVPVDIPLKAKVEPEDKRSESTIDKPKLKIKSLDGLLDPNLLLKHSSTNSATTDANAVLRSPSAVYVKEQLTLSDKPEIIDSRIKGKVIKLSPVSAFLPVYHKDKLTNLNLGKPVVVPPRPNILIKSAQPKSSPHPPQVKFIQPDLLMSDSQHILADKNVKIAFKSDGHQKEDIHKLGENNSVENFSAFDKVLGDHYVGEEKARQPKKFVIVRKEINVGKQIGNNDVRLWLNSNTYSQKNESVSTTKIVPPKTQDLIGQAVKGISSVIVLKPFGPTVSLKDKTDWKAKGQVSDVKDLSEGDGKITLYRCNQCQLEFKNLLALKRHMFKARHSEVQFCEKKEDRTKVMILGRINEDDDFSETSSEMSSEMLSETLSETSSENSSDYTDIESLDPVVEILSDDDSIVEILPDDENNAIVEILSDGDSSVEILPNDDSKIGSNNQSPHSLCTRDDERDCHDLTDYGKKVGRRKKSINQQHTQVFKSKFDKIPGRNAISNVNRDNVVTRSGNPQPRENLAQSSRSNQEEYVYERRDKNKRLKVQSSHTEHKLLRNTTRYSSKSNNSISTNSIKSTVKNVSKGKVFLNPTVLIPKLDLKKLSEIGIVVPENTSKEEELLVISDNEDEISSKNENETLNLTNNFGDSHPKINVNKISDLILKKKKEGLKRSLSKLNNKHEKVCYALQSHIVKSSSNPVVLQKNDTFNCDSLEKDNIIDISSPGSESDIFISDDEDLSCKEDVVFEETNDECIQNFKVHIPAVRDAKVEKTLKDVAVTNRRKSNKGKCHKTLINLSSKNKCIKSQMKKCSSSAAKTIYKRNLTRNRQKRLINTIEKIKDS